MPLSEPGGGSDVLTNIGGGAVMANYVIKNTGADIAINFECMLYDSVNTRLILGGNGDFIGTKANATAKLQQAPSLPNVAGTYTGISVTDGGLVYIQNGNQIFLGDANLDNWVDRSASGATQRGVFVLNGDDRVYSIEGTNSSTQNIFFFDDDGVSWNTGAAAFDAPFTQAPNKYAVSPDRQRVAISTPNETLIGDAEQIENNTWDVFNHVSFNAVNANGIAWSSDGLFLAIFNANGAVNIISRGAATIHEIATAQNQFRQSAANVESVNFGGYVPALSGFLLVSLTDELVCLVPDDANTTMQQGFYMGDAPMSSNAQFGLQIAAVDQNGLLLAAGSSNRGMIFVPPAS